jgi:hypothetical protein
MNSLENLQGCLVTTATSLSENSNLYVIIFVALKSHILHLEDLFSLNWSLQSEKLWILMETPVGGRSW